MAPIIIEFFGLPGAGKTTAKNFLLANDSRREFVRFQAQEEATQERFFSGLVTRKKIFYKSLNCLFPQRLRSFIRLRAVEWNKRKDFELDTLFDFRRISQSFLHCCLTVEAHESALSKVTFFHNTAVDYLAAQEASVNRLSGEKRQRVVTFDEGFLQRALSLSDEGADATCVADFVSLIPSPEIAFLFRLPEEDRRERLAKRGSRQIVDYTGSMEETLRLNDIELMLNQQGVPVINLDATQKTETLADIIKESVLSRFSSELGFKV